MFTIKTVYTVLETFNDTEFTLTVKKLLDLASGLVQDFAFQTEFDEQEQEMVDALERLLNNFQTRLMALDTPGT